MKHAIFIHVVGTQQYTRIHNYDTLAQAFAGLKKIKGVRPATARSVIQEGHSSIEWFLPPVVKCGSALSFDEANALADATEARFYEITTNFDRLMDRLKAKRV